jgi:hypothetical protein
MPTEGELHRPGILTPKAGVVPRLGKRGPDKCPTRAARSRVDIWMTGPWCKVIARHSSFVIPLMCRAEASSSLSLQFKLILGFGEELKAQGRRGQPLELCVEFVFHMPCPPGQSTPTGHGSHMNNAAADVHGLPRHVKCQWSRCGHRPIGVFPCRPSHPSWETG